MRKYRIVTVHRVVQKIRRSHEIEVDGLAEVAAWLAKGGYGKTLARFGGERIEESEQTLLEATITDVTHCYQKEGSDVSD